MPVVVGLSSITGISTATSGSDAAYKEYIDNRLGGGVPTIMVMRMSFSLLMGVQYLGNQFRHLKNIPQQGLIPLIYQHKQKSY